MAVVFSFGLEKEGNEEEGEKINEKVEKKDRK
jgi:hypothetical protein